ncbi:MAG: DUF2325 domain-containing protein [Lachnospiraceae bacterium]|nr:DUF2325 domain-containing protein [Lachnospiraceae bacterium]MBP5183849.1 DUF2325 domain-containing protein [Lachnospiraceae bacterium]
MSVVILGGNCCMERRYRDLCENYNCDAKIIINPVGALRNKLGNPDLVIFFTSAISHKMVKGALSELKGQNPVIEHVRSGSLSALKNVLEKHAS